jgi:hypothetical protein
VEVEKAYARAKIAVAMRYKGPFGRERVDLNELPYGSPVRVYRENTKKWEGPFRFISVDGDTVCVELPNGRKIFRSHVVRPVVRARTGSEEEPPKEDEMQAMLGVSGYSPHNDDETSFAESRKRELDGLKEQKVFHITPRNTVPPGVRIFGTRWVDTSKTNEDGSSRKKSRLVAQNYNDYDARSIPTKAPTISRMGQRLALCIAAMHTNSDAYVRDVTQAYLQSKTELERDVYLEPPPEMALPESMVLKAVKPLYGIPESGLHWFITYSEHHKRALYMKQSQADNCLLYRPADLQTLPATTVLQVDDSFGVGDKDFLERENDASKEFKTKPRSLIKIGMSCKFNGGTISRTAAGRYVFHQSDKLGSLDVPSSDEAVISTRAKVQYVASMTRPDLVSPSQLLASDVRGPISSQTYKRVRDIVRYCRETEGIGLNFVQLDPASLRIFLFTDASFGNAENLSSQLGFVIVLADDSGNANVVHFGSQKSRRVTRSVLAAEILALVYGWDNAFVVAHTLSEIFGRSIPVHAYVDSRTTFNCVAKHAGTLEKRLAIDSHALRESITRGELSFLGWIPGSENPADALTRASILKDDHPLIVLMRTNKFYPQPAGWAESSRSTA